MENLNKNTSSNIGQNIESTFKTLECILNSSAIDTNMKCAAWRQQSLIIKSLNENLVSDLMERHWNHHGPLIESCLELQSFVDYTKGKHECYTDIEFPNIDSNCFPSDLNIDNQMFKDPLPGNNQQSKEDFNIFSVKPKINKNDLLCKSRNTMENFLKSQTTEKNPQEFFSARQLLDIQSLKKQGLCDGTFSQRRNLSSKHQKQEVGFNFSATKKSLGSLGRMVNSARKNFTSPVCSKSTIKPESGSKCEETVDNEVALLLTHPALKNVDPKMVELINNEIIHKFKPVDWKEIAGLDYAKSIIKEAVVYPLLRPDIFTGLRRPPRGILLFGPPGTGKTLIGKCIASQSSSTFFSISSASLTSKWMGEGEKMVRALFAVATARQPSVIFIDEIDSLLSQRSENENEGTRRLKTEFLVRLDGAATSEDDRVLIVGATNRPQELDEAVRRRFVKRLYVPLPEVDARTQILTNLLKTVDNNLNCNDIKDISKLSEGYSGADMDSLCREASMEPLRSLPAEAIITFHKDQLRPVTVDDFHTALKKIRPSVSTIDLNQYVEWNKTYGSSF